MDLVPNLSGILIGGLLSFVAILAHDHIKTKKDSNTMRKNMAQLLHNELEANADEIDSYTQKGIDDRPSVINNVYNGLLSSGNMRYLMDHQYSLYLLYVRMGRCEPDVVDSIRETLENLEQIFQ